MTDCPLTSKQYETLLLVMRGSTYKQTAHEQGVTPSTVRTTLHNARRRLGVSSTMQALVVMLREGWAEPYGVLGDYEGPPYSTASQYGKHEWLPSPAVRLYLNAFDRLLRTRTPEAAGAVDLCFRVLCHERTIPDRRRGDRDVHHMLLTMARALARPVPA